MKFILVFAAFLSTLALGADVLWEGDSGGVHVKVFKDDVVVSMTGVPDLSFRATMQAEVDAIAKGLEAENDPNSAMFYYSNTLRPLSLENGVLGVMGENNGHTGGAHPFATTFLRAIDLPATMKGPRKDVYHSLAKLTDFFGEDQLFKALSQDKFLKKTLSKKTFKSLDDLLSTQPKDSCVYYVSKDSLKHFVFHKVEGDSVAVRIGFSHGCEVARGQLTQVGMLLKKKSGMNPVIFKDSKINASWESKKDVQGMSKE